MKQFLQKFSSKIGGAVLLRVEYGGKRPVDEHWQSTTLDQAQTPEYLEQFEGQHNIGVLLGAPSNGLCTLDLDRDEDITYFLSFNPDLASTLRNVGGKGCNFWFRITGPYPPLTKIYHRTLTEKGKPLAIGEWRSTGGQTVTYGKHPSGCNYRWVVDDAPVMEIDFGSINWPTDWNVPWVHAALVNKNCATEALTAASVG